MFRRRIAAACACALLLVVPAAAGASPIQDPSPATVSTPHGDTKFDLQPQPTGSLGDTKSDLPSVAPTPSAPVAPVATTTTSTDDGTDGWLIAALAEGALLAAIAIGFAVALGGRRRRTLHPGV